MHYRRLGKTDLNVSVVGFGASPLGGVFGPSDAEEGTRAVHLAISEGVNFFDVSPYYGLTLAEERLGQALMGRREKVILATKCGRYGLNQFDFSAKRVRLSVEESLRRLRTDHVDLLQAHDVEFGNVEEIISDTIPAMRRLQEEGKTRYAGISGYPLKVLMRIAQRIPVDTILSYCRYDLLIDDLDTVLTPFAERLGIGLINAAPLHMGMLTERGAPELASGSFGGTAGGQRGFCFLPERKCRSVGTWASFLLRLSACGKHFGWHVNDRRGSPKPPRLQHSRRSRLGKRGKSHTEAGRKRRMAFGKTGEP